MVRKQKKGLISIVGLALVAMLAFSGLAAGSAQAASWHKEGVPFTGTAFPATWSTHPSELKMVVPSRNATINCGVVVPEGSTYITESTKFHNYIDVNECIASNTSTGKPIAGCEVAGGIHFTFDGTGESVSSSDTQTLNWGPECGIGVKMPITIPSLSLNWAPNSESFSPKVTGSGTGTYGTIPKPMTVTSTETLVIWKGGPVWGWY